MEVWRAITNTLRCLWCVSNPESPLDQTSLAVSSSQAKVDTGAVTMSAQGATSPAAAPSGPSPDHPSPATTPPPPSPSPSPPPVQDTPTPSDATATQTLLLPPAAQLLSDHPSQTQSSPTVPDGEGEQQTQEAGTSSTSTANANSDVSLAQSHQPPGASSTSPEPEKSALGASAVESSNPVAEHHRGPTTTPRGWSDFKKTAKGALWSILKIAKEASAPLPPLQAVLGGIVASAEIYDVSKRRPVSNIDNLTVFSDRNIAQIKIQYASSKAVFVP